MVVPPEGTCSIDSLSLYSIAVVPFVSFVRNLKPKENPEVEVKFGSVVMDNWTNGYPWALKLTFSWNCTETEVVEERDPESVLLATVAF